MGHLSKNENNRIRKSGWDYSSLLQDHAQIKGWDNNAGMQNEETTTNRLSEFKKSNISDKLNSQHTNIYFQIHFSHLLLLQSRWRKLFLDSLSTR